MSESIEVTDGLRPRLWRWLLGTFIILIAWLIGGSILTVIIAFQFDLDLSALAGNDAASREIVASYSPWQAALAVLISFLPLFLFPVFLHRYLLAAPVRRLFTRNQSGFWREVMIGAAVMSALLITSAIPDLLFNQGAYSFTFELVEFLPYLAIALIFIPIQTTAEEVFYRGWIQQRLENGRRSIWFVSGASAILFALPHLGNPEVGSEFFFATIGYGATGFMFAWVSMRDRSIGVAVGAHGANNLLAGLILTSADSALPSASIWTYPKVAWVPAAIFSVLFIPAFIWLTGKWRTRVA